MEKTPRFVAARDGIWQLERVPFCKSGGWLVGSFDISPSSQSWKFQVQMSIKLPLSIEASPKMITNRYMIPNGVAVTGPWHFPERPSTSIFRGTRVFPARVTRRIARHSWSGSCFKAEPGFHKRGWLEWIEPALWKVCGVKPKPN